VQARQQATEGAGEGRAAKAVAATLRASWRSWWSPSFRAVGPEWLQYVWTFVFNSGIAVVLTLIAWSFARRADAFELFKWNFVISQCIGFSIHLLFRFGLLLFGHARIEAFGTVQRILFFAGIPIVGVFIGYPVGMMLMGVDVARLIEGAPRVVLSVLVLSIVMSTLWYRYMANKARLAEAEAEHERIKARAATLERQALDAQLRTLQAQIEPHFLFNTLANVAGLIDAQPADARRMLERLIELLRASLAASRSTTVTLGQESVLLRAYLEILAIRMGPRLRFEIDIPAELQSQVVPPLLVQPLVENAIKHGLEPTVAGGCVRVAVRAADGALRIEVADDGRGFEATTATTGVGLTNLRERLAALYGERARLTIEDAQPGTRVRLTLPLQAA
jgi:signal transduction histidine kinase